MRGGGKNVYPFVLQAVKNGTQEKGAIERVEK